MTRPCSAVIRSLIAAAVLAPALSGAAVAQSAASCAGSTCATPDQLWSGAAQIHQFKNKFVDALRQFIESAAGPYGDERGTISSSLDAMEKVVAQWDQAIRGYEVTFRGTEAGAELHVALGSVYLDRARIQDALRELTAAAQLAPMRADVQTLAAMAYDLANDPGRAAQALGQASIVDSDNPAVWYNLAQHLARIGQIVPAQQAWQRLQRLQPGRTGSPGTPGIQFDRASLLRQAAGIAPIFPLRLYAPGLRLLMMGRYDEAMTTLRAAVDHDPLERTQPQGPVALAGGALRRGQLSAALSQLTAAITVAPLEPESHRVLGVAYWVDLQNDRSIEELRTAVQLDPRDERSRLTLADVLIASGRVAEAEQSLKDVLQAIPESGQAHYRLGQLYQTQSLLPAAAEEFEKAAACDPVVGLDHLYETIGGLYVNQASFDRAVDAYVRRVTVNPNHADAHRKLGEIYFLQGRDDEALAEFTVTRLIDPKNADAYAASGQVYLRMNKFAEAASLSRQAIALDPEHQKARYTLGTSLMRLGQTIEGRQQLDAFQHMVSESTAGLQRKSELDHLKEEAALRLAAGEYEMAVMLLRKALTYQPDLAQLHLDLGIALMRSGRTQESIDDFRKAADLEDQADVHRYLADAYRTLGRLDESRSEGVLHDRSIARTKAQRLGTIRQWP